MTLDCFEVPQSLGVSEEVAATSFPDSDIKGNISMEQSCGNEENELRDERDDGLAAWKVLCAAMLAGGILTGTQMLSAYYIVPITDDV